MAAYQLIIIGGGLSGLAAGIRAARFGVKTLILEQHALPGGLNSYYFRQGRLFETGLHAMTNCARPEDKRAPLNRLLRQLQLSRAQLAPREQLGSEICFNGRSLRFSNDPALLQDEIAREFPHAIDGFGLLRQALQTLDPFAEGPWRSARSFLTDHLHDRLLEDMLLLPLMLYGNAEERDMDLRQFTIMFRAIFEEGFFRPGGTIRELLDLLIAKYRDHGGELRMLAPVAAIVKAPADPTRVCGVRLENGEELEAEAVLSTAGIPETIRLSNWQQDSAPYTGKMSFMETIILLPPEHAARLRPGKTIIFYHQKPQLVYCRPEEYTDPSWGVICRPDQFAGLTAADSAQPLQLRITNAANYAHWKALDPTAYAAQKTLQTEAAVRATEEIIGNYRQSIVYQDSFTPLSIERFTRKAEGAVYGSPLKQRDGRSPFSNLLLAGTDQGYLGIVGAMLSGIVVVNQHLLK